MEKIQKVGISTSAIWLLVSALVCVFSLDDIHNDIIKILVAVVMTITLSCAALSLFYYFAGKRMFLASMLLAVSAVTIPAFDFRFLGIAPLGVAVVLASKTSRKPPQPEQNEEL